MFISYRELWEYGSREIQTLVQEEWSICGCPAGLSKSEKLQEPICLEKETLFLCLQGNTKSPQMKAWFAADRQQKVIWVYFLFALLIFWWLVVFLNMTLYVFAV